MDSDWECNEDYTECAKIEDGVKGDPTDKSAELLAICGTMDKVKLAENNV